jgi:L-ascorbate metabolism protein UlaG (beta-lactamase superfamily)
MGALTRRGRAGTPVVWLLAAALAWAGGHAKPDKGVSAMLENVRWLGHAGFVVHGKNSVVVVDPFQVRKGEPADVILITHDHYDHCSVEDIRKFAGKNTVIVAPACAAAACPGTVKRIKAGETLDVLGIPIRAVPAYNLKLPNHARDKGHVGYVFTVDGVSFYHAGDTDVIPEMKSIRADVAFLPVGGTVTMGPSEAARAAADVGAKTAVPMHWGSVIGSEEDAELFKKLCKCEVHVFAQE